MTTKLTALLLAAPLALAAAPADAEIYQFDLTGGYAASFGIDSDLLAPPAEAGSDYFLVNDVAGTFGGMAQVAGSIQFNTRPSSGGMTIELPGGDFRGFFGRQLFRGTPDMPTFARGTYSLISDIDGSPSTLTIGVAGVPEPATWAMMIAGFAAVGFAMRRRRAAAATVRFA